MINIKRDSFEPRAKPIIPNKTNNKQIDNPIILNTFLINL